MLLNISCGPSPKDAALYNDKLTGYHMQLVNQLNVLEESFKTFDTLKIRNELENTKKITSRNYKKLIKIGPLGDDSLLFRADSAYYRQCFDILSGEYEKMYSLYALPDEMYGKQGEQEFKILQAQKDGKFTKAYDNYYNSLEEFAGRYNIKLKTISE